MALALLGRAAALALGRAALSREWRAGWRRRMAQHKRAVMVGKRFRGGFQRIRRRRRGRWFA